MTIHLRKMYVDSRFGQLHLHTAFPSSGGFDELVPLICIPPSSQTGRIFRPLLRDLGRDRSVYAPDLPGTGESDGPDHVAGIVDCAAALLDLIDSLRLKHVDLLGYQGGSLAALELALARPDQVRRIALLGVPGPDAGYQTGERLPLLKQPTLVLRARDDYWETTARADSLLRDARRIDLGCPHANVLETGTDEVLRVTREFFDR